MKSNIYYTRLINFQWLSIILCFICNVAFADITANKQPNETLKISFVALVLSPDSKKGAPDEKWIPKTFSRNYSVRFKKDEVQILLGNFGWEGITWRQLPVNALDAALKQYPSAHKIRLFWDEFASAGSQWSDQRTTVLFVKKSGEMRFFSKREAAWGGELHPSKYFYQLGKVTPNTIHDIVSTFTVEREDELSTLLKQRGAIVLLKRSWSEKSN